MYMYALFLNIASIKLQENEEYKIFESSSRPKCISSIYFRPQHPIKENFNILQIHIIFEGRCKQIVNLL